MSRITRAFKTCILIKEYHAKIKITILLFSILNKGLFMFELMSSTKNLREIYKHIPKGSFDNTTHDLSHSLRVAKNAILISNKEGGDKEVLIAAAILHDICNLEKNDPNRHLSSKMSAEKAEEILKKASFDLDKIPAALDAIECHSFSANLEPKTLEGRIFQDADRLDGIGAIGVARAFVTGEMFKNKLYCTEDPFIKKGRTPNDKNYTLDHFYQKLFKISEKMKTKTGKEIAEKRTAFMKLFIDTLEEEIGE